ncbi:HdeD family acid-resistance protein [Leptolyngbya sp. BC1307]|uniref:HdeD family acid-resistance protein n=1 Tax=Leptolyngbya sp. BC1307 TaxID=2029589 RepID=UPI001141063F|nr:HdeD family acid-resistance protein [Leptolyngbya sp. BC1307]
MESREQVKRGSGWVVGLGAVMIILGILAIASPLLAGVAVSIFLGWVFVIGGIVQAVDAFRHHRSSGTLALRLILSVLYIVVGALLLFNPLAGAVSLTLLIGIFFFVDGIFRVFLAFRVKPASRWGWILLNGILMIILGIFIWSQWPLNAPWILGLWIGIGLLINGVTTLVFGTAVLAAGANEVTRREP